MLTRSPLRDMAMLAFILTVSASLGALWAHLMAWH
ncbi:hypothetical protein EDF59_11979 [Novosphingobium sp. ST904]|nr:hypothetical protein EDF59_11979 [Novosphingobium sp. ST904]